MTEHVKACPFCDGEALTAWNTRPEPSLNVERALRDELNLQGGDDSVEGIYWFHGHQIDIPALAKAVSAATERQTGWLIEEPVRVGVGRPSWLEAGFPEEPIKPLGFWLSPTFHAADALRFARKCDAEVFLHNLRQLHPGVWEHCIVTDHEWIS